MEQVRYGGKRPVKERHICPRLLLRFSSSGSDPVLSANMTLTHFPAFPPLWLVSICSHSARRWRWWWAGKVEKANSWWPFVKSLLHVFSYREQKRVRFNNKSRLTSFFFPPSCGSCEYKHTQTHHSEHRGFKRELNNIHFRKRRPSYCSSILACD